MSSRSACPPARKNRIARFLQITEFGGSQACPNGVPAERIVDLAVHRWSIMIISRLLAYPATDRPAAKRESSTALLRHHPHLQPR
jgi:hypothetical protein